eukprot:TRINITY_DN7314_c0_g1_i1.p1 TRINITY_DN7314_c0_g1~~TRINITY_DN7314_c0_g1_i1.p1  ORF type:complete len:576 (-),score=105.31 TRINITY_DN7314_c0_g1_i1:155-1882(-)
MDGFSIKTGYSQLVDMIIRPPRATYDVAELGEKIFRIGKSLYQRTDIELLNPRGLKLQCSHYEPHEENRIRERLPCVIYLHGNCGCRLDAHDCLQILLPYNISLFTLDLSGSGLSDGDYLSLGYYEKEDVTTIVDFLRNTERVSRIGIWGRSMGAATAIMYGASDPSIACLVLDSAFSDLYQVARELVEHSPMKIPKSVLSLGLKMIRRTINSKAKFDIKELKPITYVPSSFIPALFVHAEGDRFILPHHSKTMFEKYAGDKNLIMVDGDHNTPRPLFFYDSVAIFFHNTLLSSEELQTEVPTQKTHTSPRRDVSLSGGAPNSARVWMPSPTLPPLFSENDLDEEWLHHALTESGLDEDYERFEDLANTKEAVPSPYQKRRNSDRKKKERRDKDKEKEKGPKTSATEEHSLQITSTSASTSIHTMTTTSHSMDEKKHRREKREKEKQKRRNSKREESKEDDEQSASSILPGSNLRLRTDQSHRPRSHSLSVPKKMNLDEIGTDSVDGKPGHNHHHHSRHRHQKRSSNTTFTPQPVSFPTSPLVSRPSSNGSPLVNTESGPSHVEMASRTSPRLPL